MWIARDKNEELYLFIDKPIKDEPGGYWIVGKYYRLKGATSCHVSLLDEQLFPEVTWESEPRWIRIARRNWIMCPDSYVKNFYKTLKCGL